MVHSSRLSRIAAVAILALSPVFVQAQGLPFSAPTNISKNTDYSYTPQVGVDAAGNINVVWEDDTANNANILFSRSSDGGATFTSPRNLSNNPGWSFNPRLWVDAQNGINVVWVSDPAGNNDIFFSRSTDGGVSFSMPVNLSNDAADSLSPQLAVDASGNISVVWESDDIKFGVLYSHSTDGVNFSAPLNLATNTGGSFGAQLCVAADGSISVVWEDDFNSQSDISFSRSTDKGATFSTPTNVSANAGFSVSAQIAIDGNGNIDVVWGDNTPGSFDILFSRSTDHGASFSSARNLSNGAGNSRNAQIHVNATGGVYVMWQENVPSAFNTEIFLARSSNAGVSFAAAENVSNNGGDSTNPWMTADASGGINVVWQDTTPGLANVFFARMAASDATFSSPQNLSNDAGWSSDSQLAADKNGNLNVVWSDDASGVNQVLFSRYSNPQVTNHAPVANAGPDQTLGCGATATLNGSGSSDPDGDALTYVWTDENNSVVGTTATAQVNVTTGVHAFTLTVADPAGLTSTSVTHVSVQDLVAPTLSVSLSPNALWPPNHKLVPITATIAANDACSGTPTIQLVSISSSDRLNVGDVQGIAGGNVAFGTDVRSFLLRAERSNGQVARVYTVTYAAKDASGNTSTVSAVVTVGDATLLAAAPTRVSKRDKDKDKEKEKERRRR